MHMIVANERKEKLVLKYATNNAKDIKALKPKVQNKHHDQKDQMNCTLSFLCKFCSWAKASS